jgi:hypothetical protein
MLYALFDSAVSRVCRFALRIIRTSICFKGMKPFGFICNASLLGEAGQ